MVNQGIGPHRPQDQTSWCCQLQDHHGWIWWEASPWVDETGVNYIGQGYASAFGRGNSCISLLEQQLISCTYSTCLLLWQGKQVGYSWNGPTCASPRIRPKWQHTGCCVPQERKRNIGSRNLAPKSEKRRSRVLSILGIKWRRQG